LVDAISSLVKSPVNDVARVGKHYLGLQTCDRGDAD
jgi:hypothetical protein